MLVPPILDDESESIAAGPNSAEAPIPDLRTWWERYWKPVALVSLMLAIEAVKEAGLSGGTFSVASFSRVLRLESFRVALRYLVRGKGLPPMTAEEKAEAEAKAAAEYANQRAAEREARKREAAGGERGDEQGNDNDVDEGPRLVELDE